MGRQVDQYRRALGAREGPLRRQRRCPVHQRAPQRSPPLDPFPPLAPCAIKLILNIFCFCFAFTTWSHEHLDVCIIMILTILFYSLNVTYAASAAFFTLHHTLFHIHYVRACVTIYEFALHCTTSLEPRSQYYYYDIIPLLVIDNTFGRRVRRKKENTT
jgi:hypothetical protein